MSREILIIDDNPDIRNILNDLISDEGYKTRVAANYNQALTEIDKKLPDVAIIQYNKRTKCYDVVRSKQTFSDIFHNFKFLKSNGSFLHNK